MKTKVFILAVIVSFIIISVKGQSKEDSNFLWTIKCKNKTHTIGLYGGLYGSYSEVMNKTAYYLGYRIGSVWNHRWGIGLAGYGLDFDRKLSKVVSDGTYHLEAGYAGVFIEYFQPLGKKCKLSFSLVTATGLAIYKYDKEFVAGRPWYNVKIDQATFQVFEPGIELETKICKRWWIGINATYRNTSPVKLIGTDEKIFNNFTKGISLKYGIF